jgi:hypothetical protein
MTYGQEQDLRRKNADLRDGVSSAINELRRNSGDEDPRWLQESIDSALRILERL